MTIAFKKIRTDFTVTDFMVLYTAMNALGYTGEGMPGWADMAEDYAKTKLRLERAAKAAGIWPHLAQINVE